MLETGVRGALTPPLRVGPLSFHERGQNLVRHGSLHTKSERSAQARKVLLSGQDRVGDESGLLSGPMAQCSRIDDTRVNTVGQREREQATPDARAVALIRTLEL